MKSTSAVFYLFVCLLIWRPAGADDAAPATDTWNDAVTAEAAKHRYSLRLDDGEFAGPGWEQLLAAGREAQFFLLGEEHGIAENARLAAQLFSTLTASGYDKLLIEVSPPMASVLDETLRDGGIDALRRLYGQPGGEPAFFGMAEEAELLASVRASVAPDQVALWGADYEVASDRVLLRKLVAVPKPPAAAAALDTLIAASDNAWARYEETGNPQFMFSFAGDPGLVRAVSQAWPHPDDDSSWILDTLEATLEINRCWVEGQRYESNRLRAALMRSNFLRYWNQATQDGGTPRLMAKLGANHLVRGRNMTQTFDLGTLLPEIAASAGAHSFSVMVLPGRGSPTAVLDPSNWSYSAARPRDGYDRGMEAITDAAFADAFTVFDLAPLRAAVAANAGPDSAELLRTVFGFDMLVVMSGSTASTEFRHD